MAELVQLSSRHYRNYGVGIPGIKTIEIADFKGSDSTAYVVLLVGRLVREIDLHYGPGRISMMLFRGLKKRPIEWGEKGEVSLGDSDTYYQFFSLNPKSKGRCVSFERHGKHRNRNVAVGLYCRRGGLEASDVERFLNSLTFDDS